MSTVIPHAKHEAFYYEMMQLLRKHLSDVPAEELLAVCSQVVGRMIAMQDARVFTSEQVMKLVTENMRAGNDQMVASMFGDIKGRA